MRRLNYIASLSPPPVVRSAGTHEAHGTKPPWLQPRPCAMGILPKNPGLFRLDGQPFEFEAFDFLIAPPGSRCELEFWGDPENMFHLMAIEFPESKDDIFALPIHSKLGEAGAHWDRLFRRGLNRLHLTKGLVSAVAVGILWSVAQMDRPLRRSAYVEEAERLIEAQHGRPIRISDLARQLGIPKVS